MKPTALCHELKERELFKNMNKLTLYLDVRATFDMVFSSTTAYGFIVKQLK